MGSVNTVSKTLAPSGADLIPLLLWMAAAALVAQDVLGSVQTYRQPWMVSPYMWVIAPLALLFFPPPGRYIRSLQLLPLVVLAWTSYRLLGLATEALPSANQLPLMSVAQPIYHLLRSAALGMMLALALRRTIAMVFGPCSVQAATAIGLAAAIWFYGPHLAEWDHWLDEPLRNARIVFYVAAIALAMRHAQAWLGDWEGWLIRLPAHPKPPRFIGFPVAMLVCFVVVIAGCIALLLEDDIGLAISLAVLAIALLAIVLTTVSGILAWKRRASGLATSLPHTIWRRTAKLAIAASLATLWLVAAWLFAAPWGYHVVNWISAAPGQSWSLAYDGRRTLKFHGAIETGSGQAIADALIAHPEVDRLELESPGGRVYEALVAKDAISKHGLTTVVTGNCASACAMLLIGGKERWLVRGNGIGMHGSARMGLPANWSHEEASMEFEAIGFDAKLAARAAYVPHWDIWYPTEAELLEYGLVTRIMTDSD